MLQMNELKSKTREELLVLLRDLKREGMNLRFQKAYDQLKNTSRMNFVRKDIARVCTELSARCNKGEVNA